MDQELLEEIKRLVIGGKVKRISNAVQMALISGYEPQTIIDTMTEAMLQVGELFHNSDIYVPEMLVAAAAMKKGMTLLRPLLSAEQQTTRVQYILGTVQGDLHDVGKNLVCCTLESYGFEVIDLGVDVSPADFVAAVEDHPDCYLLGLSALLTTTIPSISATIEALTEAGLRDRVYIMVGGAPITWDIAREVGADWYSPDAYGTAQAALRYVETCRREKTEENDDKTEDTEEALEAESDGEIDKAEEAEKNAEE